MRPGTRADAPAFVAKTAPPLTSSLSTSKPAATVGAGPPSATGIGSGAGNGSVTFADVKQDKYGSPSANGSGSHSSNSYSSEGTSNMDAGSTVPRQQQDKPLTATVAEAASAAYASLKDTISAVPELAPASAGASGAPTAAGSGGSSITAAGGGLARRPPHPAGLLMHQHHDRMVMFLASLVTYPFAFLLTQAAAAAGAAQHAGVGGGNIDTRQRLVDFPEGAAIADLESWCREPVYSSWWREVLVKGLLIIRHLLLTYVPYDMVRQVLNNPALLRLLGLSMLTRPPLPTVVDDYMPRAQQLLADGSPHLALVELQQRVLPSVEALKSSLEERHRLVRGPTPIERLDFITTMARTASALVFGWLRFLARMCTYISGLLSVISGALSFTVVPSIILSVFSAGAGIAQLVLTGSADLLEPAVNGLLALTETGKDKAASLSGALSGSPVCSRTLPPATVEQLEGFFESQLTQVSGLINRPEIPRLAGVNKSLLVKAYDLGLIDALGRTEGRAVRELLATAQAQGVLHILLRGTSRAAVAAVNFDVAGVLTAANELAQGLINRFMPSFMGGGGTYAKQLFRKDGFFAYADERQSEVALVLLCRLLSWLHLGSVVAPGSLDCLHFVLILGESQAGKASLFAQLVAAPAEYASQLGGTAAAPGRDTKGVIPSVGPAASAGGPAGPPPPTADLGAPAIDMRPVADCVNIYACVFPGLHSRDAATSRLSNSLATTLGGLASAVVFLVNPSSEPSPDKLAVLEGPLSAGRHVLVAINGPGRVKGLLAGAGAAAAIAAPPAAAGAGAAAGVDGAESFREGTAGTAGPALPGPSTPLESLRGRWQAAAEQFCSSRGLAPSLVGVVVSELQNEDTELPPGVHKFKQVQDWIINTARHAHRMV